MTSTARPTRREERRTQTVQEIKERAMDQISAGGPEAVTLSGIVREMSMSPAAVYRYFASRDALLADLVVDAYDALADFLVATEPGTGSPTEHLPAILHGIRAWALEQPNAYRLIFQTSIGSGQDFAVDRTVPAASRSMAVIVEALVAVTMRKDTTETQDGPAATETPLAVGPEVADRIRVWAGRSGLTDYSVEVLLLALLSWTRLHGIISLEIGGHLGATGIGAPLLFEAEVGTIRSQAAALPPAVRSR